MDYQKFGPEWRTELKEWLEPVGKASDEVIDQMEQYLNDHVGKTCLINVYWCKNGHNLVTIDHYKNRLHIKSITCPYCKEESRSMFYWVDQSLSPHSEFYTPTDIQAFPKAQQAALKQGFPALKAILSNEPKRRSVAIRKALKPKPKQTAAPSTAQQVLDRLKPTTK